MCGILYSNNPNISDARFNRALDLLHHRGPDAKGCTQSKQCHRMGHKRLKILDLDDRSNQPFVSSNNRFTIIYNGEIYNYIELAKDHDLDLKTTGDTEVLIELYAKLGPEMLQYLNGMFAMVIYDSQSNTIFIARDRLGIKPLYYFQTNESLIVSSEIAAIIDLMDHTEFDEIGIRQYRKLRTFFNGRTLYKNIKMFPAGYFYFDGKFQQYWSFPIESKQPPDNEELRNLIESSVNYRCISDVTVGSYLSGGLDSTIIAKLAQKPDTWTVGFRNHNEFEWGQMASKAIKSRHTEVLIEEDEFVELAKHMIHIRKEPLSVPNEVLLYKMTRAVKEKNTVILSGEGADELFFGYDRIFRWAHENKWNIEEFDKNYSYGTNDDLEIIEDVISPFMHYGNTLEIVAAFFQVSHLHGLLRRLDNATMHCSVEARVPFVDHRIIERMAGTPFEFRMRDGIVKAPLKGIFQDQIPAKIIQRTKIGFPVPLEHIAFNTKTSHAHSPMDAWLMFNLETIGIDINSL